MSVYLSKQVRKVVAPVGRGNNSVETRTKREVFSCHNGRRLVRYDLSIFVVYVARCGTCSHLCRTSSASSVVLLLCSEKVVLVRTSRFISNNSLFRFSIKN